VIPARRPFLERVALGAPVLVRLGAAVGLRLKPGNRVRRWAVRRAFQSAWAGINRGDFEPALLFYERDAEVRLHGAAAVGLADSYSGNRGWPDFIGDVLDNFGDPHFEVRRVRDGGHRLVMEVVLTATGKASGAPVEQSTGNIYLLSPGGRIIRQEIFFQADGWERALAAAGFAD
jgi:hypothetical protein